MMWSRTPRWRLSLGTLNRELASIKRNKAEDNWSTAGLTAAVKEQSQEIRGMSTTLDASITTLSSNIMTLINRQQGTITMPDVELDIRRMASDFDVDWPQVQNDHVQSIAARRASPPHFHSPLDERPGAPAVQRRAMKITVAMGGGDRNVTTSVTHGSSSKTSTGNSDKTTTPAAHGSSAGTSRGSSRKTTTPAAHGSSTMTSTSSSCKTTASADHSSSAGLSASRRPESAGRKRSRSPEDATPKKRGRESTSSGRGHNSQGRRDSPYRRREEVRNSPGRAPRQCFRYGGHYKGLARVSMNRALRYWKRWIPETRETCVCQHG